MDVGFELFQIAKNPIYRADTKAILERWPKTRPKPQQRAAIVLIFRQSKQLPDGIEAIFNDPTQILTPPTTPLSMAKPELLGA